MDYPENPYELAYEGLLPQDKNEVNDFIWEKVGDISKLNREEIEQIMLALRVLRNTTEQEAKQKELKYEQSRETTAEFEVLIQSKTELNKNLATIYRIDTTLNNLQKRLSVLLATTVQVEPPKVDKLSPKSAIPPRMRGLEIGARKGSQPPPSTIFSGAKTATGHGIPSTPPPVPPLVKPIDSSSPTASAEDKSTAPPSFSHATYKPRAGSTPTISLGATRKGSAAVTGGTPQIQKPPSPLAAETSTPASRSGTGAPPLASSSAEQVGASLTTTKRPVVADASSAPFKPTPLPSSQSKMIMEKINLIAEQVAAKKINAEKASEEIAQIIIQMDRDMHASIKMAKDKNIPSVSIEQRKASLAPTPTSPSITNIKHAIAPKDERLLHLEQAELAKYMRAYETIHFYLEFPVQQKADIDTLKYAVEGSIVACDPLMNDMFELSKRKTEIERLEQIEKRENWEKVQKQNDLKKRIEDPKNAHQKQMLEEELASLIKNDDAEYERKLPVITKLQQEKEALTAQLANKVKSLTHRSQDWLEDTLDTNDAKNLKEIIVTKERVVNLWLKVAEILYQNHDYEGLFQVQSVLNQLYGTIELKGQKQVRKTADIILDDESVTQLDSYARLGQDNTYAKEIMRQHIKNNENFIPLLAITAPAFISATLMFDPLVKLVKPETNAESLERRANEISNIGKETRAEWQKKINSAGTDEIKKKEFRDKLLLSDLDIGKEVLKRKLEATDRTVTGVIVDTDSFESHLPRTVVLKSETMLSKAKVVELNTGEVVSGVAQRAISLEELNKSLQTMIEIRNKQQPEVEKSTDKDNYIGLIDLNRKIFEAVDEKLKLLDTKKDFEQIKACYEEKERCFFRISTLAKSLESSIDKKNKDKWTRLIEDIRDKNTINNELKLAAYDNVATHNYQNFLTTLKDLPQKNLEFENLKKIASSLFSKFNIPKTSEGMENYIQTLSNVITRISLYSTKFGPPDETLTVKIQELNAITIKLECAKLALSLDKELAIALEMGTNPKSIADITKYKDIIKSVHENSRDAEAKLKSLGAHVDPFTISIMKKLRHLGDKSQSVGDKLLTGATLTSSTISQTRTPPH